MTISVAEADLDLGGGRTLHYYVAMPAEDAAQSTGPSGQPAAREGTTGVGDSLVVFWQHGTPNIAASALDWLHEHVS